MKHLGMLLLATCAACGPGSRPPGNGGGPDANTGTDAVDSNTNNIVDAPLNAADSLVYAHTADTLYKVDATTYVATAVGMFNGIGDDVTDIAVDKNGNMVAITDTTLYSVNVATAAGTQIKMLGGDVEDFTGLGYVPDPTNDAADLLVTASSDGNVYTIDPTTGAGTMVGNYGKVGTKQIGSSGDIFGVRGDCAACGIYATVKINDTGNDYLAKINPSTWVATPAPNDTGFQNIFGIGFWAGTIFGFDDQGDVLEIDPTTGKATMMANDHSVVWWGAGVTTNAPIIN